MAFQLRLGVALHVSNRRADDRRNSHQCASILGGTGRLLVTILVSAMPVSEPSARPPARAAGLCRLAAMAARNCISSASSTCRVLESRFTPPSRAMPSVAACRGLRESSVRDRERASASDMSSFRLRDHAARRMQEPRRGAREATERKEMACVGAEKSKEGGDDTIDERSRGWVQGKAWPRSKTRHPESQDRHADRL